MLKDTTPHFVRCLRPNAGLAPARADAASLVSLLLREDQGHVLAAWRAGAPEQEAAKRAQLEQVRGLERGYPGGLAAYLRNARKLLAQSAAGDNPFEGMRPEVRKNE